MPKFKVEAIDAAGKAFTDVVEASTEEEVTAIMSLLKKYLFEDANGTINGEFDGTFNGDDAHIKIDSPITDSDNLLNNIHFQNIAHQISLNLEEADLVKKLCSNMSISYERGNLYKNIKAILDKTYAEPQLYAQNLEDIEEIRRLYGYLPVG